MVLFTSSGGQSSCEMVLTVVCAGGHKDVDQPPRLKSRGETKMDLPSVDPVDFVEERCMQKHVGTRHEKYKNLKLYFSTICF